jgi:adenylate cyclase
MASHVLLPQSHPIRFASAGERLRSFIERRLTPGTDRDEIDRRIWDTFGEEWSVMFTDLAGFSRAVADFGVVHFLQIIYESLRVYGPIVDEFGGTLLKVEGDSMIVLFRRPEQALGAAVAMQRASARYNVGRPEEERLLLGVGVGHGRLLRIGDLDVYGAEVNAASKLGEDRAAPFEILVTEALLQAAGPSDRFEHLDYVPPGATGAYRFHYDLDGA